MLSRCALSQLGLQKLKNTSYKVLCADDLVWFAMGGWRGWNTVGTRTLAPCSVDGSNLKCSLDIVHFHRCLQLYVTFFRYSLESLPSLGKDGKLNVTGFVSFSHGQVWVKFQYVCNLGVVYFDRSLRLLLSLFGDML